MKKNAFYSIFQREYPFFLSAPALIWLLLFFYIPLFFIIGMSFISSTNGYFINFEYFSSLLKPVYALIIKRSLVLALVTSVICLVIAYPVAYFIALRARKIKNMLLFLLILPFATNLLVHVYAWFFVLERSGLINNFLLKLGIINQALPLLNTPFAVYLVMVYCYLPFMILPIYSILEKFDVRLIEASLDLGASRLTTFIKVILPLSLPGISTGFFLVFIPSFGEFVIPGLMGGAKYFFVGSLISHYFLIMRDLNTGAAFTFVSNTVLLIVALLFYWYFRRVMKISQGRHQ